MTLTRKLRTVKAAYQAGLLSERQAYMWAYRITCHLPYNCADPQDRLAHKIITGRTDRSLREAG